MKKTLLVAVLAIALSFAFAAQASAAVFHPAYTNWDAAAGDNGLVSPATPHAGYTVSTVKCAVCHSVHNAPAAGAIEATTTYGPSFTATGSPVLLLRSDVANSCRYCHIDTAIGGVVVYGGTSTYDTIMGSGYAGPLAGDFHGTGCTGCHSVHGANAIGGAVAQKILQGDVAGTSNIYQDEILTNLGYAGPDVRDYNNSVNQKAANAFVSGISDRSEQVTVFCTRCHDNWDSSSVTTVTAEIGTNPVSRSAGIYQNLWAKNAFNIYEVPVKHHPLANLSANWGTSTGAAAKAAYKGAAVAFKSSLYCSSCHDAGNNTAANDFPHLTSGADAFMMSGANAGATLSGASEPNQDGVCLKCHRNGDDTTSTAGVGIDF